MATRTRKTTQKPAEKAPEKPAEAPKSKGRVYRYEQRVWRRVGDPALPGPDTAAVTAALNAGERPTGPAVVEDVRDLGASVVVVWAVPVEES